jgi:hypothetical protein
MISSSDLEVGCVSVGNTTAGTSLYTQKEEASYKCS